MAPLGQLELAKREIVSYMRMKSVPTSRSNSASSCVSLSTTRCGFVVCARFAARFVRLLCSFVVRFASFVKGAAN